jgi:hypothetical protein
MTSTILLRMKKDAVNGDSKAASIAVDKKRTGFGIRNSKNAKYSSSKFFGKKALMPIRNPDSVRDACNNVS